MDWMQTLATPTRKKVLKNNRLPSSIKSKRPYLQEKAFTLLEVMIVLIIIASIMVMAIPRLSSENQQIKADIRRFSVLARRVLQAAQLKKRVYRLVIQIPTEGSPSENEKENKHSYWIEKSTSSSTLNLPTNNRQENEKSSDEEEEEQSQFEIDKSLLKEPKSLPDGYIFSEVAFSETDVVSEGRAYVYFFPQGFTMEALIKIRHKEQEIFWSLLINPLTGNVDVITQNIQMKELRQGN